MAPFTAAVVGLGVGRQHLDAMAALPGQFHIAALCDTQPGLLQAQAQARGVQRCFSRFEDLLREPDIELVSICTPPHLHRAQIAQALAAGKQVVCEKPLVVSLRELDEVAAACAAAGRRVFPIFQVRWGLGLQQLQHLQAHGLARRPRVATVETHWQRGPDYYATAWRGRWAFEHGGVCVTQAIHAHDLLTAVLGPVASVSALLATRVNDIEVEDCAAVSLRLASGALASLSATLGSVGNQTRLKFVFDDLVVESASANPYRPAQAPWTFTGACPAVDAEVARLLQGLVPQAEGFVGQFADIHRALRSGEAASVGLADSRAALELVTAIYQSAETGRQLRLPIGPGQPGYDHWRPAASAIARAHGL